MTVVLVLGLLLNAIALPIAGRRIWWLYRLIRSGQPAPDRVENVSHRIGTAVRTQLVEVFGQRKLLKWSVPGAAHFFVFWAFLVLATVYLEAYGALFDPGFHIPWVGRWPVLGFLQDFIAVMALLGIITFAVIRLRNRPERLGRRSRFEGSHLGGAWLVLLMIFNVLWTMFLFRGSSVNTGHFPYRSGAFVSEGVGRLLEPLGHGANEALEHVGLLLHIGVMLAFLILVLNSKHLHIFVAPLNVLFSRRPVALGAMVPMTANGQPVDLENLEDLDDDTALGVGKVEDFTWKGLLDFATCTECGRCQSQCPAWNTDKPLSPKLLIMGLRDHAFAKAPYLQATTEEQRAALPAVALAEAERPLVADTGDDWFYMPDNGSAVIDPDVLWSCTSCGACVNQCPVDIEHVDHIMDMRRYQVLVESSFPSELNGLFRGMENKGNPWNMSATARLDWAKDLPFEVKVVGEDVESLEEVDWLFWVGCAGAYEDRAKKTTRAVAELLDMAGVDFAVLGNGETCTGDPARRAGNEFVFQGLATQNAETFKEMKAKKVVSTCAHCFNTLKNEYQQFGVELEVVHHTQLLNRLVREKRLTPVAAQGGTRSVTYHDPCYLGRHNQVYSPPRELLEVIPDANFVEMPRNSERSFCCGAGGARMWMEENIGERINVNRTKEAVDTGADQIAVGCPFCRVMLADGLTQQQSKGEAREEVEVLDVAQMLLASVKGESSAPARAKATAGSATGTTDQDEETKAEPEAGDTTQTENTVTATEDMGPAAKASGSGGSLFDVEDEAPAGDRAGTGTTATSSAPTTQPTQPASDDTTGGGGSLFDLAGEEEAEPGPQSPGAGGGSLFDLTADEGDTGPEPTDRDDSTATTASAGDAEAQQAEPGGSGSLFDVAPDDETTATAGSGGPAESSTGGDTTPPQADLGSGGSLFDIDPDDEEPQGDAAAAPEDTAGDSTTDTTTDRAGDDADTDVQPDESSATATADTAAPPQADLGSGGSLFDVQPDEEEPHQGHDDAPEDTAGDSTTDTTTDRAADDADTDVAPDDGAGGTTSAGSSEEASAAGSGEDAPIRSLKEIKAELGGGGSETAAPSDSTATDDSAQGAPDHDDADTSPGPTEGTAEGTDEGTDAESDGGSEEGAEAPRTRSSGEKHAPRTDASIDDSSSLFDL